MGGGAAGYFFAINVSINYPEYEIVILEQGRDTLGKVRVSGGGRCNVTHACFDARELVKFYPRGEKEMLGPFHRFSARDTMQWFEERGVKLKIESDNRVFPVSDSSQSIIRCLEDEALQNGVKVITSSKVMAISMDNPRKVTCSNGLEYDYDLLFLATGSSKYIWNLLQHHAIDIVEPVPSLFTFHIKDDRLKGLQGLAFDDVVVISEHGSYSSRGPLLITHWGMSAPAILKLSSFESRWMAANKYNFRIVIDFLPGFNIEQLISMGRSQGGKLVSEKNPFNIPRRYWTKILEHLSFNKDLRWADINRDAMDDLVRELKSASFSVSGKSTFKEEFVSAGGIDLKEIDFKNFRIKKLNEVYAAGEILNIDAVTGGFNFQAAWTGAFLAAQNI